MNSEQKFDYETVQVYKLKKYFGKTHYQNGDFQAIGERVFSRESEKKLNIV